MDFCQLGRLDDLLVGGLRPAVAYIFHDAVGKEKHLLLDDTHLPPQGGLGHLAHILAVHPDGSLGDVVEPGNQLADGGLAAPGGAHKGELFPGVDIQAHVPQNLGLVIVPEVDVVEGHISFDRAQVLRVGGVLDLRVQAHQLQKPGEARRALHELLHEVHQLFHRRGEGGNVKGEGHQVRVVHCSPHNEVAPGANDQHGHN